MKRDMVKTAGTWMDIPDAYQMTTDEIKQIKEMLFREGDIDSNLWDVTGILFRYGFQLGRRYEKRHGSQSGRSGGSGYMK